MLTVHELLRILVDVGAGRTSNRSEGSGHLSFGVHEPDKQAGSILVRMRRGLIILAITE